MGQMVSRYLSIEIGRWKSTSVRPISECSISTGAKQTATFWGVILLHCDWDDTSLRWSIRNRRVLCREVIRLEGTAGCWVVVNLTSQKETGAKPIESIRGSALLKGFFLFTGCILQGSHWRTQKKSRINEFFTQTLIVFSIGGDILIGHIS